MKINSTICRDLSIGKNKSMEFQISRWEESPAFGLNFWVRDKNQDHRGFQIVVTILFHEFSLNFYDNRHSEDM